MKRWTVVGVAAAAVVACSLAWMISSYLRDMGFLTLYAVVVLGIAYARLTRKEA